MSKQSGAGAGTALGANWAKMVAGAGSGSGPGAGTGDATSKQSGTGGVKRDASGAHDAAKRPRLSSPPDL